MAGSGDVLCGAIGCFWLAAFPLASRLSQVYWHGFCGPRFQTGRGALASELAHALPQALAALSTLKDASGGAPKDCA